MIFTSCICFSEEWAHRGPQTAIPEVELTMEIFIYSFVERGRSYISYNTTEFSLKPLQISFLFS